MRAPHRPVRILLLSGASLVGQNILSSLSGRRSGIRLIATSSVAAEPSLFDFDAVYLTPEVRSEPKTFGVRFAQVLAQCEPDLVIPCRDDDVSFLADQLALDPGQRRRFLCGDDAVALAMLDKLESWRFSQVHGLPFAPTLDAHIDSAAVSRFAREHGFPLLAKPRKGFASRNVRLILSECQLERICMQSGYVLQRYLGDGSAVEACADDVALNGLPLFYSLEGTNVSIQTSIAPDGAIARVFVALHMMRLGRSESVSPADDMELESLGRRWAEAFSRAGWRGPLNIQGQRTSTGEIAIHEYNGRFTGATAARYLLGFDEVGIALRDWLGQPLPAQDRRAAHIVIRFPMARNLDAGHVNRLSREGYWESQDLRPA